MKNMSTTPDFVLQESDEFFVVLISRPIVCDDEHFIPYIWREPHAIEKYLSSMKCGGYGTVLRAIRIEFYLEGEDIAMGINSLKGLPIRYISFRKGAGIATVAFFVPRKFQRTDVAPFVSRCYWTGTNLVLEKQKSKIVETDRRQILTDLKVRLDQYIAAHHCPPCDWSSVDRPC